MVFRLDVFQYSGAVPTTCFLMDDIDKAPPPRAVSKTSETSLTIGGCIWLVYKIPFDVLIIRTSFCDKSVMNFAPVEVNTLVESV